MTIHGLLRLVIRNDAIKIDPPEIYNWRVIALAASVSISSSYDITLTVPRHASLVHYSASMQGLLEV
jgi:hypothetical protein